MSCSTGKCNCGSSCSCGSSCNCNSSDIEMLTTTTTTVIVDGVAPQMTYVEGTETSFGAEGGNGCKCGANCKCDPCNC